MPVHFAAARCSIRSPIARALARKPVGHAANDNGDVAPIHLIDEATRAALMHFAEHGLGSALAASKRAEQAQANGDHAAYDQWLDLCRTFDSRLAARIERRYEGDAALIH